MAEAQKILPWVYGDLLEKASNGEFDAIVLDYKCDYTMENGITGIIKKKFFTANDIDFETKAGDLYKLGTLITVPFGFIMVIKTYILCKDEEQTRLSIDYDALRKVWKFIFKHFEGKTIGIPKIGAGYDGDWKEIQKIIYEECKGTVKVKHGHEKWKGEVKVTVVLPLPEMKEYEI